MIGWLADKYRAGLMGPGHVAKLERSGPGDVVGPGSAVNGRIAVFDGTTGKLLRNGPYSVENITEDLATKVSKSQVTNYMIEMFAQANNASSALTKLGVSSFIQNLLDDTTGAAAWLSLGGATLLSGQGAVKLPNGLMLEWGYSDTGSGEYSLVFHTAFPSACIYFAPVLNFPLQDTVTLVAVSYANLANTGAYIQKRYVQGGTVGVGSIPIRWLAMGY
ncbi:hypothetical protein ABID21_001939 [Pseudorhizobium tarimense]|uniref:Putative tail fiber protein gp53-like C-terminal domain-containing protein n=1 Tax=Pseudorhizobium tarimense TaxID=1079109 RepID=A0ABV2H5K9_9HYPH|nr:hypothetical protein [Pseudorhizobium tarimense]MCJ8519031.1 hypothetical protein [Pseudorhizobium tarimense]